jgi:hypothetical protein
MTLAALLIPSLSSAENLLENASFEVPKIEGVVAATKGGTPVAADGKGTWAKFLSMDRTGHLSVGLTNQLGRTGSQSLFVKFQEAAKTRGAMLMSDLIPIKGLEPYRISIWGRIDRKQPLTLDGGRPFMLVDIEYYPADQASRIGSVDTRTQMIPGKDKSLLFVAGRWSEYFTEVRAPEGAEFMKVTFRWESPKREGAADGLIYFDDAVVEGPAGNLVSTFDPPEPAEPAETPAAEASGAAGAVTK